MLKQINYRRNKNSEAQKWAVQSKFFFQVRHDLGRFLITTIKVATMATRMKTIVNRGNFHCIH